MDNIVKLHKQVLKEREEVKKELMKTHRSEVNHYFVLGEQHQVERLLDLITSLRYQRKPRKKK